MKACRLRTPLLLAAVLGGIVTCASGCRFAVQNAVRGTSSFRDSRIFYQGRHGPLDKQEQNWAKIAWKYFQNNYQSGTGLVSTTDKGNATTMWTVGDSLAALYSARSLRLIDDREFNLRLTALLSFLNRMPLAGDVLPNLTYRIDTGAPLNAKGEAGIEGWSSIDIGRLLVWLYMGRRSSPFMSEYLDKAVLRWDICHALDASGMLYGGRIQGNDLQTFQEGRLGYEEYAAQGFQSWGFATDQASRIEPFATTRILGIEVYYDSRDERSSGILAPVVSLPYVLDGLEFNWDPVETGKRASTGETYRGLAQRIYRVQEARYKEQGVLTARTDHMISHPPFYVYDSIFALGYPWNTITGSGQRDSQDALVATQIVFPVWTLWKSRYTDALIQAVKQLYDSDRGWYEGRFEATGSAETMITARTNAMVLESLAYQVEGKLYRGTEENRLFKIEVKNPFGKTAPCISTGARDSRGAHLQ
jgi:hypothetical protein